jgi:hypothetical protein
MSEEYLGLKVHLQNLSNEAGRFEADLSCMAYKIRPDSRKDTVHDVLIQSLGRISEVREKLKKEEESLTQVLMGL